MYTPLFEIALHDLLNKPVIFDANIFMVGIENRITDKNCSFESMRETFIEPLFDSFSDMYIHIEVYNELDQESRAFVDKYVGKNVTIVNENGMYGTDPKYTTIFNKIATHELVNYTRGQSKDRGEVYSMAYAAYHNMNFFCSKEIMVDIVAHDLKDLLDVEIITFDIVLLAAYVFYAQKGDNTHSKGLKAMYKKYCADVIKRHKLPATLGEYIRAIQDYL